MKKWEFLVVVVTIVALAGVFYAALIAPLRNPKTLQIAENFLGKPYAELKQRLRSPEFSFPSATQRFPIETYEKPRFALMHKAYAWREIWCVVYVFVDERGVVTGAQACFT